MRTELLQSAEQNKLLLQIQNSVLVYTPCSVVCSIGEIVVRGTVAN